MMKIYNIMFFLTLLIVSCKFQDKWEGKINKVGIYEDQGLKIVVKEKGGQIEYFMLDSIGDTLVQSDRRFSSYQRWALHLDKNKNLWVFSSDIGHACWKQVATSSKEYINEKFIGGLSKDSLSADVWNTLKEFYPYSKQK